MTATPVKLLLDSTFTEAQVLTEDVEGAPKRMYITGPFLMFDKPNRNKRVYPGKIMEAAVNKYIKEYVEQRRALGEMNHPCLTEDAKVFVVNQGLTSISDVRPGDYVLGTDSKNQTKPVLVKDVTRNHFKGDLLHFDSRSFKATVTPYHRMYLKNRKGEFYVKTAQEVVDEMASGERHLVHDYIPQSIENWVGSNQETIQIGANTFSMKDYCAFMGIFLSEGSVHYRNRSGERVAVGTMIHQNDGVQFDLICDLIQRMDLDYRIEEKTNGVGRTIYIKNRDLTQYLSKFGNCYEKFVPQEVLQSSKKNIIEFLDWYHLGDGANSYTNKKFRPQQTVFTVSEKLADGLIEAVLKCGYSTTRRIQLSKKDYVFADHLIEIKNKKPLFRMTMGRSKGKYIDERFMEITRVPHDDDVFCLITESSNFWVEQHGTMFLTGNCGRLQVDPERACILTESLEKDGNYYIGRAKVLSTPLGKTLQCLLEDGVKIGVSSRGVGTLQRRGELNEVKNDFNLTVAADIVFDPSVGDAFVEALMEEREYVFVDGAYVEKDIFEAKTRIKVASSAQLEEKMLGEFQTFLNKITAK